MSLLAASPSPLIVLALSVGLAACPREPGPREPRDAPKATTLAATDGDDAASGPVVVEDSAGDGGADADRLDGSLREDAAASHYVSTDDLIALVPMPVIDGGKATFPRSLVKAEPGRFNQGNAMSFPLEGTTDRAQHNIAKSACLEGLRGITLQTDEQRTICRGEPNMVPIYRGGKMENAKACIDVFEFPNVACELPFVWGTPKSAESLCKAQGKRLCAQEEWNLACGGDPAGGADRMYAYGEEPDLTICNTNKPHPFRQNTKNWVCSVMSAKTAWDTCATETEPVGAYPKCRSRFGVFDQHGNVAEMMTRKEGDDIYTQLKGSAFFYVDVFRRHDEPQKKDSLRETYPDHCKFDPRWHVEPMTNPTHSNYHLGFRCCKSLGDK